MTRKRKTRKTIMTHKGESSAHRTSLLMLHDLTIIGRQSQKKMSIIIFYQTKAT
jgi:hypothetical protein